MMYDEQKLIEALGISLELKEHSQVESMIQFYEDKKWYFYVHPPIEANGLIYFQIYNAETEVESPIGPFVLYRSSKIARISMTSPEYIHCSDCSKKEWILNHEEKEYLCSIITGDMWKYIQEDFGCESPLLIDGELNLPMPDYMQLPE